MTLGEDQLRQLLERAAPASVGVDPGEISRRGRRLRRRRLATAAGVVAACAAVGSLAVVVAVSTPSGQATISPLPGTDGGITTRLTPAAGTVTRSDLDRDVTVLTRRLAAAGIDGRAEVVAGGIRLHVPTSAAGSVDYLTGSGQISFRIPSRIRPTPTPPVTASAGSCLSSSGPAAGNPPPCISARLTATCPKPRSADGRLVAAAPAEDWIVACDTSGTAYALAPQRLNGDAVRVATATLETGADSTSTGQWVVTLNFTAPGQRTWADLTEAISSTTGCPDSGAPRCSLAIVVDGVVESAPIIQGRIDGAAQIAGSFSEQPAKALAAAISSGSLPVPLVAGPS